MSRSTVFQGFSIQAWQYHVELLFIANGAGDPALTLSDWISRISQDNLGAVKDREITEYELGAVQSIVMAVSAGGPMMQFLEAIKK